MVSHMMMLMIMMILTCPKFLDTYYMPHTILNSVLMLLHYNSHNNSGRLIMVGKVFFPILLMKKLSQKKLK